MTANVVKMPGAKRRKKPLPPAPPHLDDEARAEWRRVAPVLADRGDLGPETLATLETYCTQFARWRTAEAHVAEHGVVVAAPRTGVPMHNPHLAIANKACELAMKLAKSLRITPESRPQTKAAPDAAGWDDDGLLA
jgi:P27 family predicted phage terminase small subunit